jgi:hypothetical protein
MVRPEWVDRPSTPGDRELDGGDDARRRRLRQRKGAPGRPDTQHARGETDLPLLQLVRDLRLVGAHTVVDHYEPGDLADQNQVDRDVRGARARQRHRAARGRFRCATGVVGVGPPRGAGPVTVFPTLEILATGYPAVVQGVAARLRLPRVRSADRDIRELGLAPEFDAAVVAISATCRRPAQSPVF